MNYCTEADIRNAVRADVLRELADDDRDGAADGEVIAAAIAEAEGVIDTYCAPRYATPFQPVPTAVRRMAIVLAVYALHARRGLNPDTADRAVMDRQKDVVRMLEKVAEGKVAIGTTVPGPSPAPQTVLAASRPAVFTQDALGRM